MSSSEIVEGTPDAPEGAEGTAPPKSRKKLILIGGAAAVTLLLGGGGAAWFFLSGSSAPAEAAGTGHDAKGGSDHGGKEKEASGGAHGGGGGHGGGEESGGAYVDVPAMVVNLRSPDGQARFLKLHFMFVPGPAGDEAGIKAKLPAILDAYQPFLRELRPEDLAGSAAVFRIKEELLLRAREAGGEGLVDDVLIQDLVQQ